MKHLRSRAQSCALLSVFYLACTFAEASLNIADWDVLSRGALAVVTMPLCVLAMVYFYGDKK